jgi:hypothetical protein
MTCEPCISSQAQEADSLPTLSLDTRQLSLLSGIDTPAKSCENEQPKDGSPSCTCGKGMSDCSIHPRGMDEWVAYMRDSLARTLALQESRWASLRERDRGFTVKSCVLQGRWDTQTSSWKTLQTSFLTDSEPSLETWPRWGMSAGGFVYKHRMSGQTMNVIDGSSMQLLATPTATANQLYPSMMKHKSCRNLAMAMLPTPTAHNAKEGGYPSEHQRNTPTLAAVLGGKINPQYTEWMMGWPLDHTALRQSETVKSRSKPQSHGSSLEASK